ncbi:uncharacterized protein LOC111086467 isoform X2 [Limulus polyphemus]|uniref:Uncharacterized protein LOC111086467 isoform X2 n=1 Tax=Limulus polyphemus TaxID=6850 RepID=A0ABM1SNC3_LIMPO|nr:uncharacterized protein LOC111086467 isoform X2 [Limulus polyphemus]
MLQRRFYPFLLLLLQTFFMEAWSRNAHNYHHRHRLIAGCSRCSPGYSVVERCSRNKNTECAACRPGTYLPHHSYKQRCYPCSRCGEGLYIAHQCTSSKDTVCDSCHTYRGPHNKNFHQKCVLARNNTQTSISRTSVFSNASVSRYLKSSDRKVSSSPNSVTEKQNRSSISKQKYTNKLRVFFPVIPTSTRNISKDDIQTLGFHQSPNTTLGRVHETLLPEVDVSQVFVFTAGLATMVVIIIITTVIILKRYQKAKTHYTHVPVYDQETIML